MSHDQTHKPPPPGWRRIASAIFYDDAAAAIDWLCATLGFEVRLKVEGEGGRIEHSELIFGDDMVMISSSGGRTDRPNPPRCTSPHALGGANTQALCIYIDDVDRHFDRAQAAGATIAEHPNTSDYGPEFWVDRGYRVIDPEGHHWWFMQRVRG